MLGTNGRIITCLIGQSCVLVGKWARADRYFVLCIHVRILRLRDTADTGNKIIITDYVFICVVLRRV